MSSHHFIAASRMPALVGAALAALALGTTTSIATGQGDSPLDDRYGAVATPPADGGDLLIAYRADEAPATNRQPAPPKMAVPPFDRGNPLRRIATPAPANPLAPSAAPSIDAHPPAASVPPIGGAPPGPTYEAGPRYDSNIETAGLEISADDYDDADPEEEPEVAAEPTVNGPSTATPLGDAEKPSDASTDSIPPLAPPFEGGGAGDDLARRLAPLSAGGSPTEASSPGAADASRGEGLFKNGFSKLKKLSTAGGGLAVVVVLFIACMWLLRRGGGRRTGSLPAEAFAVLGRAPLAAQSFAQLLRVGNKLVLVAVSPDGAQPLTEVTDPVEVGRLIGLCASGSHGPSAEFQQVLAQLAREPARGFLGGEATPTGGRRR